MNCHEAKAYDFAKAEFYLGKDHIGFWSIKTTAIFS